MSTSFSDPANGQFFPYGTQYHRAPTPLPEEWPVDLERITAQGYTHVQFRPQWRWHEAVRGKCDFTDLDALFDLAAQWKLRVILKPMLECAPDWVFGELGGTRIGFHGVPISPVAAGAYYVGGWWPDFDNPAVMDAACRFVREMTDRYKGHSALWLYDAWNEPRNRPIDSNQSVHSNQKYREWLRQRYGTIEELNRFFGKRWTSFETIQPPAVCNDYVEMFLWRNWAADTVSSHVKAVVEAIRCRDASRPVMVHRGACDVVTDILWDAGNDVTNIRESGVDFYGLSCRMVFHPLKWTDHDRVALQCDWIRHIDKNFWCQEFYPCRSGWDRKPSPEHLERQLFFALATGCKGFTWWQYRSERVGSETDGFGLVEVDGSPTPRSEFAERVGAVLAAHGPALFEGEVPQGKAALVYSRDSDMVSRLTRSLTTWDRRPEPANIDHPYKRSLRGAHALYTLSGIEMDFLTPEDPLENYRIVHCSGMEMVNETFARRLEAFVEKGGFLLVEYPFASRTENTWVSPHRPSCGLEKLLGCRESGRIVEDGYVEESVEWPGVGTLPVSGFRCDFEPLGAKVMATWQDGKPALLLHRYGKGTVCVSGLNVSHLLDKEDHPLALKAFLSLVEPSQAQPLVPASLAGSILARRRVSQERQILFVFNFSDGPHTIDASEGKPWWGEASGRVEAGQVWVGEFAPGMDLSKVLLPVSDHQLREVCHSL